MTLAKWLEQRKMTQTAFAKKVALTQGRISQIITNGTRDIATAMRIQQATEYEVTLHDLLSDKARERVEAGQGEAA